MKKLLFVALMLFCSPAYADSGFDNFTPTFKEPKEVTHSHGQGRHTHSNKPTSGSHCIPSEIRAVIDRMKTLFGHINIISAHRPGAKIAGSGKPSYHASCQAVDVVPPKNKYNEVAAYLKATWNGGVGTYSCGHRHIHIDTGPHVRFHKCK